RLTASDGVASASALTTVTVLAPSTPGTLTLAPAVAGPDPVGGSQALTARLLDSAGLAVSSAQIAFAVTGANATSGSATTDATGAAVFTYSGASAGTDLVVARAAGGEQSNTAQVTWLQPAQVISTTTVEGRF